MLSLFRRFTTKAKNSPLPPSERGRKGLESGRLIDLENEIAKLPRYHPESCPDGLIDLSGAENDLMLEYMVDKMEAFANNRETSKSIKYGGVMGSNELLVAVSSFINKHFCPVKGVRSQDIIVTNGVSSLLDLVIFNICDPGEGVLVLTPNYAMFPHDVCVRTGARLINVNMTDWNHQFHAEFVHDVVEELERTCSESEAGGVRVKALLISNPNNPCGRCYPKATLLELARFCARKGLHFISDEIYAMSIIPSLEDSLDPFTSVLQIAENSRENIHCLYGASKDFGAGGLRLGFMVTRNELFWKTCRRLALFTWVTTSSADFFAHFLTNHADEYLTIYRDRLRKRYADISALLHAQSVPFQAANGGIFVLLDLSKWLQYVDADDSKESSEAKLGRYLAYNGGVYLSFGELSLSPVPGYFRLVYTCEELPVMGIAITRLSEALARLETRVNN